MLFQGFPDVFSKHLPLLVFGSGWALFQTISWNVLCFRGAVLHQKEFTSAVVDPADQKCSPLICTSAVSGAPMGAKAYVAPYMMIKVSHLEDLKTLGPASYPLLPITLLVHV